MMRIREIAMWSLFVVGVVMLASAWHEGLSSFATQAWIPMVLAFLLSEFWNSGGVLKRRTALLASDQQPSDPHPDQGK